MSVKEQIVAAIDIGTTKIVSIVGKKNDNGKIEILGLSKTTSEGVRRGVVTNIRDTRESILRTIKDVETRTGVQIRDAFVGIAGQHISCMKHNGYIMRSKSDEEITQEDIDRLTNDMKKTSLAPGQEILHIIPQEYIVDKEGGIYNPIGMFGTRLEANFHLVIEQTAAARNVKRCVEDSGINMQKLILEPLASAAATLTEDEKEGGVALVDIGGGTTDIAIYYDKVIRHTAVIPFGGNLITKDIREGCCVLERYAEKLKIKYGSALSDQESEDEYISIPGVREGESKEISFKSLAGIIQARMEEIISAIDFQIKNSGFGDKLAAGVVITGGGAMLKNLSQLMEFRLGMPVRIGLPNAHITGEGRKEIDQPMFSTAVGLILSGFEYIEKEHDTYDHVIKIVTEEQPINTYQPTTETSSATTVENTQQSDEKDTFQEQPSRSSRWAFFRNRDKEPKETVVEADTPQQEYSSVPFEIFNNSVTTEQPVVEKRDVEPKSESGTKDSGLKNLVGRIFDSVFEDESVDTRIDN